MATPLTQDFLSMPTQLHPRQRQQQMYTKQALQMGVTMQRLMHARVTSRVRLRAAPSTAVMSEECSTAAQETSLFMSEGLVKDRK